MAKKSKCNSLMLKSCGFLRFNGLFLPPFSPSRRICIRLRDEERRFFSKSAYPHYSFWGMSYSARPKKTGLIVLKIELHFCTMSQEGAVSNANFRAFEAALFLYLEEKCLQNRKKPRFEAKKSMTKRGSVKSSFLRVIQFRRELV